MGTDCLPRYKHRMPSPLSALNSSVATPWISELLRKTFARHCWNAVHHQLQRNGSHQTVNTSIGNRAGGLRNDMHMHTSRSKPGITHRPPFGHAGCPIMYVCTAKHAEIGSTEPARTQESSPAAHPQPCVRTEEWGLAGGRGLGAFAHRWSRGPRRGR